MKTLLVGAALFSIAVGCAEPAGSIDGGTDGGSSSGGADGGNDGGDDMEDGPGDPGDVPADLWTVDRSCEPMLWAQLVPLFPPGGTSYTFANPYAMAARHRDACNEVTGCTPWEPDEVRVWFRVGPRLLPPSGPRAHVGMRLDLETERIHFGFATLEDVDLWYSCSAIARHDLVPVIVCEGRTTDSLELDPAASFSDVPQLGDTQIYLHGTICADGRFHFVTKLGTETGGSVEYTTSRNQIAIYGRL